MVLEILEKEMMIMREKMEKTGQRIRRMTPIYEGEMKIIKT